jgi:signal transduction histidine kinase
MDCSPTECRYLSQATHLLLALARDGTIRRVDRRNPKALGYAAGTLDGKPLGDLVAQEHRPHLARVLERCESGQPVWDELVFLSAEGRQEPMLCCFQPAAGAKGAALLVTGLRLRWMESQSEAEAAAALAQVAFRCHGPAHRLVQATEAMLAEHPRSEAARRCRRDVDRLLDAMCRSAGWPSPADGASGTVDVVRVLEGAVRLVESEQAPGKMEIRLRPDRAAHWASAHPVGLALVALHLVANARQASAKVRKARLLVSVHDRDDRVVVEFADNGSGLSREDLGCVFAPFFRKAEGDGLGLGLATCRELVRWMGGTIRMQSRKGQGTLVRLALPAATPPH